MEYNVTIPNFERLDAVLARCKSDPTFNQRTIYETCFGGFALKTYGNAAERSNGYGKEAAKLLGLVDVNNYYYKFFDGNLSLTEIEKNIKELKQQYGYTKMDNSREEFLKEVANVSNKTYDLKGICDKYWLGKYSSIKCQWTSQIIAQMLLDWDERPKKEVVTISKFDWDQICKVADAADLSFEQVQKYVKNTYSGLDPKTIATLVFGLHKKDKIHKYVTNEYQLNLI